MEKASVSTPLESKHRKCKEIKKGMGIDGLLKKFVSVTERPSGVEWTGQAKEETEESIGTRYFSVLKCFCWSRKKNMSAHTHIICICVYTHVCLKSLLYQLLALYFWET